MLNIALFLAKQAKQVRWQTAKKSHNGHLIQLAFHTWARVIFVKRCAKVALSKWRQSHMSHGFQAWHAGILSSKSEREKMSKVIIFYSVYKIVHKDLDLDVLPSIKVPICLRVKRKLIH